MTDASELPRAPSLTRFGHLEAWRLGSALVDRCLAQGHPVTIAITIGSQRVFQAGLPGTSHDNDRWVQRKTATVQHFGVSSAEVGQRYLSAMDPASFHAVFDLVPAEHCPGGGAVPIFVGDCPVGVVAVSGLVGDDDHRLCVDGIVAEAERQQRDVVT